MVELWIELAALAILIATLVARADAATLTRLFPRFTLAIIQLGLDFSLCSAFAPFTLEFNN